MRPQQGSAIIAHMKQLCNFPKGNQEYCELESGFDTGHLGRGPCQFHDLLDEKEVHTIIESPTSDLGSEIVRVDQALNSVDPIISELSSLKDLLRDMLQKWQDDDTYTGDNFPKFDKTVEKYIKAFNSIEKTINDKNMLELRRIQVMQTEQDWQIAYAAIEMVQDADTVLADKIIDKLKRRFGSYELVNG